MLAGRQAVLLRKGGILEANNEFELEHRRFLFYPTFVHQDPRMVKEGKREEIRGAAREPEVLEIRGYGEVVGIFAVPGRKEMDGLRDLHVWDEPLIDMRFGYRPEKPLYVVVVRAFVLGEAVVMENSLGYAGCKSWVSLEREVDVSGGRQVMEECKLQEVMERIRRAFA